MPKTCAENDPEVLLLVHGNDKTLILNNILQVKNYQSFKVQLKNANDPVYVKMCKLLQKNRIICSASRTYL